jgi:hypothetical protein
MDSYEWHFRLIGDEFDIDGLTELFGNEAKLAVSPRHHSD